MSESEWLASEEPDLMLEEVEGMLSREQLMEFVRRCWERITPYLPPVKSEVTVVEQFAALAPTTERSRRGTVRGRSRVEGSGLGTEGQRGTMTASGSATRDR